MSLSDYESVKDPDEEMERLAQSFLPLKHWGFTESFRSKEKLIFDSQLCRVSFVWSGWDMDSGYNLSRYYGRLHAPNNSEKMNWNGEECYCWHSLMGTSSVSDFLDGLTPQESANSKDFPKLIQQFRQSDLWHN